LLRIVGGTENRLQVTVGNNPPVNVFGEKEKFSEFVYNPIKAVYRWLFYRLQGGKFIPLGCDGKPTAPPTDPVATRKEVEERFFTRQEVEEKLSAQQQAFNNSIAAQREAFTSSIATVQQEFLSKIQQAAPPAPQDAAADKDTSKSKKDK
jgi:hypothetical protein